jgi:hypothetical protein
VRQECDECGAIVAASKREAAGREDRNEPASTARMRLIHPRDVALSPTSWIMRHRIPRNELTLFDGDGGVGKTTVAMTLLAALTNASTLPDGSQRGPMTALVADENRRAELRAMLQVAGANLERVRFAPLVECGELVEAWRIPNHVGLLGDAIETTGAEIAYIDALFSHFGSGSDSRRLNASYPADLLAMSALRWPLVGLTRSSIEEIAL